MFICFLSLFVRIQVCDEYVNVLSIIVFFSHNLIFRYIVISEKLINQSIN
jgi:hypothetical protein